MMNHGNSTVRKVEVNGSTICYSQASMEENISTVNSFTEYNIEIGLELVKIAL